MDFALTGERRQIREEVGRFGENEIAPVATEYDREERYPHERRQKAAETELVGPRSPSSAVASGTCTTSTSSDGA